MLRGKDDDGEEEEKNERISLCVQFFKQRQLEIMFKIAKKQMRFFIVDMKHFSLRFDFEEITK